MSHQRLSDYSTHPLPKLLKMWEVGDLTVEQIIGHLLQHLAALEQELKEVKKEVRAGQPPRKG